MKNFTFKLKNISTLFLILLISNITFAQEEDSEKKERKKKDEFKVMAGTNFNNMSLSSNSTYNSSSNLGYLIGAKYKRGKFFYWEVGARYNAASYKLSDENGKDNLNVKNLDVPINVGVNLLSVTSRIVGLRAFVGALPTFVLNTSDNDFTIEKDDLNTFLMQAQLGVGVDIAFFFLEAGVNYGFTDVLKTESSNPTQGFINLGFRF